jgi:hypothetical protein
MFGPQWLVAPVVTYQATSRSVYLPALDANHTWVYFFNMSSVGGGGARVTWASPDIGEFPLYFVQPIQPPPPLPLFNMTSFYSAQRNDTVLCLDSACYQANVPGNPGGYVEQRVEAVGLLDDSSGSGSVTINGTAYPLLPLTLYYSFTHNDNLVTTNTSVPDASYTAAGGATVFDNGFVLGAPAPGAYQLQIWFRDYNGADWDYATVGSPAGLAWVAANGYINTGMTAGWALPLAA